MGLHVYVACLVCLCDQLHRVAHKPTKAAWVAVTRIFRYLRGTLDFALVYKKQQYCRASIDSDSNWAGNQFTRMTTGGGDYFIGNSLILWKCKTMKEIFTSTFHSESAFISFMGKIGSWLIPLTKQIFDGAVDGPVVLYNDNQSEFRTSRRARLPSELATLRSNFCMPTSWWLPI